MASTLLLDRNQWDLTLDASGNIAVAGEPYSLAQDAASAIKLFLGEYYWDITIGVPYGEILGARPPLALLKQSLVDAAETVPDVASAQVFISNVTDRLVSGQVQVTSTTGQPSAADFVAISPQGGG